MQVVLLSPHRDDAAFSCAVLLRLAAQTAAADLTIVNIWTCSDYAPFVAVDGDLAAVSALRAAEDDAYSATLPGHVRWVDLGQLDAPLRLTFDRSRTQSGGQVDHATYTREVEHLVTALRPALPRDSLVIAPLALGGHVDHRIVRDAARVIAPAETLAYYEDLPYAARLHTSLVVAWQQIQQHANALDDSLDSVLLRCTEPARVRLDAAMFYPSQVEPATIDEMGRYTEQRGGEMLFAGQRAAAWLRALTPRPGETD